MSERFSFIIDRNSRILSWGKEIGRIAGQGSSSALGKPYYAVLPRLRCGRKDAVLLALRKGERIVLRNYFLKCPEPMTADIMIAPVSDPEHGGVRVTVAPTNDQGRQGMPLTDASTLAHGVRNPLHAMKGAIVYLGQKYGGDRNLSEFVRIMDDEIAKFDRFISDLLARGGLHAGEETTDLNAVLGRVRILTSFQTQCAGIAAEFTEDSVPPVKVNAFHLEHAILNVVNNAICAMAGGGSLTVALRVQRLHGAEFAVIDIADTGPGIARNPAAGSAEGRGFGLRITRQILAGHGGFLEIGEGGKGGTRVSLFLPAHRSAA